MMKSSRQVQTEVSDKIKRIRNKYKVDLNAAQTVVNGVIELSKENLQQNEPLFLDDVPIQLQINTFKIPDGPSSSVIRIPLQHGMFGEKRPDVCIIMPNKRSKQPWQPRMTIEEELIAYENFFQRRHVTGIRSIMTLNQFRMEYDSFELKRKLTTMYDLFLMDRRIGGQAIRHAGKVFYKASKVPIAFSADEADLAQSIENKLKLSPLHFHTHGTSFTMTLGFSYMSIEHLVDNLKSAIVGIARLLPGGYPNVRSLNICVPNGAVVPIYVSLKNPNKVVLRPYVQPTVASAEGELSTNYNTKVTVFRDGTVITKRLHKKKNSNHLYDNRRQTVAGFGTAKYKTPVQSDKSTIKTGSNIRNKSNMVVKKQFKKSAGLGRSTSRRQTNKTTKNKTKKVNRGQIKKFIKNPRRGGNVKAANKSSSNGIKRSSKNNVRLKRTG